MKIKETMFSKSFSVEHEDSYLAAMRFMKKLSKTLRIYEKKNIFETDGPVKRCVLIFDAVEPLDQHSSIRINFNIHGENEKLYIDVVGYFVLKVEDYGFFTEVFTEFYLKSLFPGLRKASESRMNELKREIEAV